MDIFTVRVKLSEAGGYNSIGTGWAYLSARGNHGRDSRSMGTSKSYEHNQRPNHLFIRKIDQFHSKTVQFRYF